MNRELDFNEITCPKCNKSFLECCRTKSSLRSFRRFCKCSDTICQIGTETNNQDNEYNNDIIWISVNPKLKFIPMNWRAAILGATYTLSEKETTYLEHKRSKLMTKFDKLISIYPKPRGKKLIKFKSLYNQMLEVDATIKQY